MLGRDGRIGRNAPHIHCDKSEAAVTEAQSRCENVNPFLGDVKVTSFLPCVLFVIESSSELKK